MKLDNEGSMGDIRSEGPFIAALDVGTTTVRCYIYNGRTVIRGSSAAKVELLYPQQGWVEIDHEHLWQLVLKVIRDAIADARLTAADITCLGITNQRSSFVTWHAETGVPYHNFITWKDLRANDLVQQWNRSFTLRGLRTVSKLLYFVTQKKRFLAGSVLKMMNTQVLSRLLWALDNVPDLKTDALNDKVQLGTVDTWLIYKLTGGKQHVTDYSNASATAMFDPFTLKWNDITWHIFGIPMSILPQVKNSSGDFGYCSADLFGEEIPIKAVIADQGASLFGSCCFDKGDVKITLGTGAFLNVNTGRSPHASVAGLYPVVGWKFDDDVAQVAEGPSNDTGTAIEWGLSLRLYNDAKDTAGMAKTVSDTGGVYFIPAFSGLQAPYNDGNAASGFIGVKSSSSPAHLTRAILESIAFRVVQLYEVLMKETNFDFSHIRVDGGVSNNDFIIQLISDLTNQKVERPFSTEMSVLGAAYMAGLAAGIWHSKEDLSKIRQIGRVFEPDVVNREKYKPIFKEWKRAATRFMHWYE